VDSRFNHLSVYSSIFLLSASALAYEVLLIRLFSIILWHHFAYMIIGLALLGYGVSGTLVSLLQQRLLKRFEIYYPLSILLFGLSSFYCFQLAQNIPFNAEVIFWDPWQIWFLVGLFILLAIPFFFAATAICLAFMRLQKNTAQIYAADLIGAGAGSLLVMLLLFWLFPQQLLLLISLLSILAVAIALSGLRVRIKVLWVVILVFAGTGLVMSGQELRLNISPYKDLSQALQISGTRIVEQRSSPLGLLTVIENDSVPFRYAPGLSLNAVQETLPQQALFTDGGGMNVITEYPGSHQQLSYFDYMTSALAYHLSDIDSALVVGGAGGADVLQASYHQVAEIDVLELNPQVIELVDKVFGDYTGRLYSRDNISVHDQDVRDYLGSNDKRYQLIQMSLLDASSSSSSGLHALNESYLFTAQAMQLYLQRLQPSGYLSLTRWISIPPRDTLKLFNTAVQSLKDLGYQDSAERLVLIRGWQTSTLIIKNGRFVGKEIQQLQKFVRQRSFDLAWFPGIEEQQANRYNRLSSPLFFNAARQILSDKKDGFIDDYKFDLRMASDDRPYFHLYFKWKTFKELYRLRDQGGMPLMEWGYLTLIATLLVSLLFSVLLILIPLWVFNNKFHGVKQAVRQRDVIYYFFAIGLAFLMMEIAFMQKFILFLHHPIYSVAVTLTAFLVFAGAGSQMTQNLVRYFGKERLLLISGLGIFFIGLFYLFALGAVFELFSGHDMGVRMVITIALIAPLAWLMGMPFPLALSTLAKHAPGYIPWAWGINGCASVISASLATLISVNFGFNVVIVSALLIYLSIIRIYPRVVAVQ